ncbi:MAG: hypothetical protein LBQ76_02475 [Candidatus Fibromonas sp.]|nr:hypothetical protein [Candidatus Fibromonas sp.]
MEHALEMAREALNETLVCELEFGKHLVVPKTKGNAKKVAPTLCGDCVIGVQGRL